jgi:hypothetical protein
MKMSQMHSNALKCLKMICKILIEEYKNNYIYANFLSKTGKGTVKKAD